jgi:hypothetical protein
MAALRYVDVPEARDILLLCKVDVVVTPSNDSVENPRQVWSWLFGTSTDTFPGSAGGEM